ncbi:MAG TPA: PDZ domain-containing protein [Deltaproteobacteria bacterium]|nr:PDZ domain-containing protein [Deltaproteobacteria bacterium]
MEQQRITRGRIAAVAVAVVGLALWGLLRSRDPGVSEDPGLASADASPPTVVPGGATIVAGAPGAGPDAPLPVGDEAVAEEIEDLPPPPSEGLPGGRARCRLQPALASGRAHVIVGDPDQIPYDGRLVDVRDGVVEIPWIEGEGAGVLAVEGYAPVPISWAGGGDDQIASCAPDPLRLKPGVATVEGTVHNAEGQDEGRVFVEGCGNQARPDADGGYSMTVSPGRCVLNAFRHDGLLLAHAQPAEVVVGPADTLLVDFEIPARPRAGLGLVIESSDAGIRVLDVLPGTAADELGLQEGDLVLEVDGTPTPGIALEDFVELAVGPVGTEVEIVVDRGQGSVRLLLDRRELKDG